MDLTALLLRAAAARPRVLLAAAPAAVRVRLAAERELRLRDLPEAVTPADADVLLIAGTPGPELDRAVDRLWQDMPEPRARVRASRAQDVAGALDAACAQLAEGRTRHQRRSASAPPGLPMAERGPDRDGLTLDRLHIPLGPLLADWPPGLTARLTLQGDVVQEADVRLPPPAAPPPVPFWAEPWRRAAAGERITAGAAARRRAAARLDSLGRFLSVAGWPAAALAARRLRDDLLGDAGTAAVRPRAARLARRVGRSRILARLTRGIGPLTAAEAAAAGITGPAARADGDVPARCRLWLAETLDDLGRLDDDAPLDPGRDEEPRGLPGASGRTPSHALAAVLPRLLAGAEFAAARLIVASLDPDPEELAAGAVEGARG
ncbi:hypothetical protein QCN29_16045 [Streptomyces sp. HNM0663]|uniref:Uncharacterized protein n=1 Tax=Streptomyces chengmaiensis TaxID=3040919 RepID=A0ABT6HNI3_9ACTN|nr:hypothetical protein [Streptomyces chengmaiensis]MDH2390277.1 hypothetical protein [Streptomyces chengmaiensis]